MKIEDIKIGMKVVPHSKNIGGNLESFLDSRFSNKFKSNGFLYVVDKRDYMVWLGYNIDNKTNSYTFLAEDVHPYNEKSKEEPLLDKVFQNHVEVELRKGLKGIVVCDVIYNTNKVTIMPVIARKSSFDDELKNTLENSNGYDIMKATLNGEVVYKREQEKWSEWKLTKNPRYRTYYRTKGKRVQVKVKGFKTVVGEARCSTEDAFRLKKGMDIAYNRAIINLYQKKLDELLK